MRQFKLAATEVLESVGCGDGEGHDRESDREVRDHAPTGGGSMNGGTGRRIASVEEERGGE